MVDFTFVTGPETEDRASINMYGTIFTVGQAVAVTDPMVVGKLRGMPKFFKESSDGDGRGTGGKSTPKGGVGADSAVGPSVGGAAGISGGDIRGGVALTGSQPDRIGGSASGRGDSDGHGDSSPRTAPHRDKPAHGRD